MKKTLSDLESLLSRPIEEKVRNPFFLALMVSILSYNKKFIFTVFLPADGWNQRWTCLGEYWIKAGIGDYLIVVSIAIGITLFVYFAGSFTYTIAMFYNKRMQPWIGNLIFKKGFVERSEHENLKSIFEVLEKKHNELIERARKLNNSNQGYQDSIGLRDKGLSALKREIDRHFDNTLKELIAKYRTYDSLAIQGKLSNNLTKESQHIFESHKIEMEDLFNDGPTFESIKTSEER